MSASRSQRKPPPVPTDLSDRLLDSAKEFLIEALRNHRDNKGTFAIVHAVTAAELVLKARLAKINPTLIHRNIDSRAVGREPTIGLRELPQRLANLGHGLDPNEAEMIGLFAGWRNAIVHHLPMHDDRHARSQVRRLVNFIAEYLQHDLDISLRSFLPRDLYTLANEELQKWKKIVASARAAGPTLKDACPACGTRGVLSLHHNSYVVCNLCEASYYRLDHCLRCGRKVVIFTSSLPDQYDICNECASAVGYLGSLLDRISQEK